MYNGPVNKERYEMKAVFKGYKKEEACGKFTIGKHYRIEPDYDVEGIFIAVDDDVYCTTTELEIVEEGEVYETTYTELFPSF